MPNSSCTTVNNSPVLPWSIADDVVRKGLYVWKNNGYISPHGPIKPKEGAIAWRGFWPVGITELKRVFVHLKCGCGGAEVGG